MDLANGGIQVKNIRKMKSGQVLIETGSKESIEKIKNSEAIKGEGWSMHPRAGRKGLQFMMFHRKILKKTQIQNPMQQRGDFPDNATS